MRILIGYLIIGCLVLAACQPDLTERHTMVLGHSGSGVHMVHSSYVPNSMESIQAATAVYSLDGVEVDLQFTKDMVPVLFRNKLLQDETDASGVFYETESSALKEVYYLGWDRYLSDQKLVFFQDFIAYAKTEPDVVFSVDLKNFDPEFNADLATDILINSLSGVERSRFFVESNLRDVLLGLSEKDSSIRCIYNRDLRDVSMSRPETVEAVLNEIAELEVEGVIDHFDRIEMPVALELRKNGLLLFTFGQKYQWNINEEISRSSDLIQLDNPILGSQL